MDNARTSDRSPVNIAMIMIPKVSTVFLHSEDTVRQGLEILRRNTYTAVPVLDAQNTYMGCVTEGDFLRHILATGSTDLKFHERFRIKEIFRPDFCKPLHILAPVSELVTVSLAQNFVPIVDDRNVLCGIVTRRSLISFFARESGII